MSRARSLIALVGAVCISIGLFSNGSGETSGYVFWTGILLLGCAWLSLATSYMDRGREVLGWGIVMAPVTVGILANYGLWYWWTCLLCTPLISYILVGWFNFLRSIFGERRAI